MFEEENVEIKAAKVEDADLKSISDEQPTSPVDESVNRTKAFATRLKEEKAKAKDEARSEIAQSFGYDSWESYMEAQTNNKLIDKGLDPDSVRPVIKDLIKNDPEYVEAMKYKAEKEELEKELFASNALQALNNTFGTAYKSINELDEETIDMWNKGTPLEKAFAANNWSRLQDMAVKASSRDNGKSHLKTVVGSGEQTQTRELSKDELKVFASFGISEERAKEYLNRTKK
jgi:hypothetical protein